MKKTTLLGAAVLIIGAATAQTRQTRQQYVEKYRAIAVADMERYGIPASITMAQGILESDSGNSFLSLSSNNHFGIKCKTGWTGRSVNHDDDAKGECFRAYDSVEESYRDHAEFLDTSPRYDSLFRYGPTDYRSWARGLRAAGYATDPTYAARLVKIIEEEKLYLLDDPASERQPDEILPDSTASGELDPDHWGVTVNDHRGRNVYRNNGATLVLALADDSYERIAADFSIGERMLRRFNDTDRTSEPKADQVVYITRKSRAYKGDQATHTLDPGQTLLDVAQHYGIRLRALQRLNRTPGNEIRLK